MSMVTARKSVVIDVFLKLENLVFTRERNDESTALAYCADGGKPPAMTLCNAAAYGEANAGAAIFRFPMQALKRQKNTIKIDLVKADAIVRKTDGDKVGA